MGPRLLIILPDLRGHDRSSILSAPVRHEDTALDFLALFDDLGIRTFKGVGISAGRKTLIHLATKQPSYVKAMVIPYFPTQALAPSCVNTVRAFPRGMATLAPQPCRR